MVRKIGENIISPLGFSVAENFAAVMDGRSALQHYDHLWGLPFPCFVSLLPDDILDKAFTQEVDQACLPKKPCTRFEKITLLSATKALQSTSLDPSSPRVMFILSSTKGNVSLLADAHPDIERVTPVHTAQLLARYFGNPNMPIVVSNACISGLCAQIEAYRCLQSGQFDAAVVVGADVLSPFIVSGFQSLKALSDEQCHPFSSVRKGLNLGEAAATVVYAVGDDNAEGWQMLAGAMANDANHISGPSRTGEGSYRALMSVLQSAALTVEDLACLNVHGTSTLYNDEMEAVAIHRAGLAGVPVNALKGYYGHTLGAAGILETLLTMHAVEQGVVPATRGYEENGVTMTLSLSSSSVKISKTAFVKLLSGFGGCNAAAAFTNDACRR
ncbi:MAG: beta-ketoacyl synthase [Bacteroidales bacterium]|nr:beta-ketoacyl synthase [Bacteroidales bacterium]